MMKGQPSGSILFKIPHHGTLLKPLPASVKLETHSTMRKKLHRGNPNSDVKPLSTPFCCPVSRKVPSGICWFLICLWEMVSGMPCLRLPFDPLFLHFLNPLTVKLLSFFPWLSCAVIFMVLPHLALWCLSQVAKDTGLGKGKLRLSV